MDYPVGYEVSRQQEYSRFLPLVKWLLAIPHYFALFLLGIGFLFAKLAAWLIVVVTGRYPKGIFGFELGVLQWGARVHAYLTLLTDRYPPFALGADPTSPVALVISYPGEVERWRPFFAWLLAIPYVFVGALLGYVALACIVISFFAILFTKRVPDGVGRLIVAAYRWQLRGVAYGSFLVTSYPPWDLD